MQRLQYHNLFREACYLNGQWVQADNGVTYPISNPSNGRIIGHVPQCCHI